MARRRRSTSSRTRRNRLTFRALCPSLIKQGDCDAAKSFCKWNDKRGCKALPRASGSKCGFKTGEGKDSCLTDPRCRWGKRGCISKPYAFPLKELNQVYDPDAETAVKTGGRRRRSRSRSRSRSRTRRTRRRSRSRSSRSRSRSRGTKRRRSRSKSRSKRSRSRSGSKRRTRRRTRTRSRSRSGRRARR